MKKDKFQHPLFLLSLVILLLNDFYLKAAYGNVITGKLSDFAGLLAFPFFFSCLFPERKRHIHIFTALIFVWWKSSLSGFFIDGVNSIGIPISRVIDFSDNIALISIAVSYLIFSKNIEYKNIKPAFLYSVILVSSFAFMATSIAPRADIEYNSVDKEYEFNMPLYSFIYKFNGVLEKEMDKYKEYGRFNETGNIMYSYNRSDTLIYLIDPIKHNNSDTINLNYYMANIQIYEKDRKTVLKLIDIIATINHHKAKGLTTDHAKKVKFQEKVIKQFEKRIIKKIK